ncbi:glycosyltransferase family 2 protein [Paraburkholderia largidicola]|uniref:glycosyltransferase family 2 protein n=1 Tax=Paraburkholderia largidicola TaxID=3014751 RepID=UPI003D9C77FE
MDDLQRTGIVVVFYHPDDACIQRANRFARFGLCVVVDNTEPVRSKSELRLADEVVYISNGANLGIATALNQGVEYLVAKGCETALLFDQDSEPSSELLTELPLTLKREMTSGRRVAVIGPAYEDARLGGVASFVRFSFPAWKRIPAEGEGLIDVDFLITSGSCVNLAAWRDVGPMDDVLFIDFVDVEWCVRARRTGYAVLGSPSLRLSHSLGGEPIRVMGRNYPSHSPVRHYYLFRNAIALMGRRYMPWSWKGTELIKLPVRVLIYGLCLTPRFQHVRMALLGIWHGMIGRMGAL